jgi:hypothetical protein
MISDFPRAGPGNVSSAAAVTDKTCTAFDSTCLPPDSFSCSLFAAPVSVAGGDGSEPAEYPFTTGLFANVSAKYTLSEHLWRYLQAYARKHRAAGNGFGFGLVGPEDCARTLSARYHKDGSEILVRNKPRPRRLTPRECSRLMGFDAPGRRFVIPVSDTQAYRQFGNAVVPLVVERIARGMARYVGTPGETRWRLGCGVGDGELVAAEGLRRREVVD